MVIPYVCDPRCRTDTEMMNVYHTPLIYVPLLMFQQCTKISYQSQSTYVIC